MAGRPRAPPLQETNRDLEQADAGTEAGGRGAGCVFQENARRHRSLTYRYRDVDRLARPGRRPASTATRRGPDRISRYRLPLFFIVIRPGIGPFEGFLLLHRV